MNDTIKVILFLFLLVSCSNKGENEDFPHNYTLVERINFLKNPISDYILVASHRGNWQVAPENSLASIQSCIDLGVDIVEIDVQKTRDGHLIVMHDSDLDRTTNAKGTISGKTLDEIKQFYLIDRFGNLTQERVPTLKEVMELAKGNIVVMIDKANDLFSETLTVLKETQTLNQALFIEPYQFNEAIATMSSDLFHNSLYVPRIKENVDNKSGYISPFITADAAHAFEIRFSSTDAHTLDVIPQLREANISIWMTALGDDMVAGFTDSTSLIDPDFGWGKCIELGANILMTDYPEALINYLNKKEKH